MKTAGHIALAVGVGYLLGRKRRLRTAMLLGAAAAAGRAGKLPGGRLLESAAPGAGGNAGPGGPAASLVSAGRVAARTALGRPIEAISDRLNESAEALRQAGKPGQDR